MENSILPTNVTGGLTANYRNNKMCGNLTSASEGQYNPLMTTPLNSEINNTVLKKSHDKKKIHLMH